MSQSTRIAALALASLMASFVVGCAGDTSKPDINEGFSDLTSTSAASSKDDAAADTEAAAPAKTSAEAEAEDSKDPANRRAGSAAHSNDRASKDPLKGN